MSEFGSKEYLTLPNLGTGNNVPEIIDLTLDTSEEEGEEEGNRDMLDRVGGYAEDSVHMLTEEDPLDDVTVFKVVSINEDSENETVTMVTEEHEELTNNPETCTKFHRNSRITAQSVCDSDFKQNMLPRELPDPFRNGTIKPFDMNMPVLNGDMDSCALPNRSAEHDMPLSPVVDADRAEPSKKLSDQTDMSKNIFEERIQIWNDDCINVRQVLQKEPPAGSDASKPKRMKRKCCHLGRDQRVPEVLPMGITLQNIPKEPRNKYTNIHQMKRKKKKLSKTMSGNSQNPGRSVSKSHSLETHQHPPQTSMEELRNKSIGSETDRKSAQTKTHEEAQLKDIQHQGKALYSNTSALSEITCLPSAEHTVDEPVQHLVTYDTVCYEKLLQAADVQDIGHFCDKCSVLFSHGSQYRAHMTYQGQCSGRLDVLTNKEACCRSGNVMMEVQTTFTQQDSVSCASFKEGEDGHGKCDIRKSHHIGVLDGPSEYLYDGRKAAVGSKGERERKKKVLTTKVLPEVEVEQKKYQLRSRKRAVGEKMDQPQSKTSVSCTRTPGTVVNVKEDIASCHTLFYVCGSKCGYTTLFYRSFKMHVEECLLFGSLSCIHCGFKGMTLEDLTGHMEAHLEQYDKMFRCTEESCVFYTDIFYLLKAHLVDGHRQLASYRCFVCETVCEDLGSLVQHMEDNIIQVAWCRYCDAVACDLTVIQKHGQESHPRNPSHLWTMDRLLCADRKRNGAMETYPGIPAFEPFQGRMAEASCKNADPPVKDITICETKENFPLVSTNVAETQVCFYEDLFHDVLSSHTDYLSDGGANIFRSDIPSQQSLNEEVDNPIAEESDINSQVNINLSLDTSDLNWNISGMQSTKESVTSTELRCRRHTATSVASTESNDGHAATAVTASQSDDGHVATAVTSTDSDDGHAATAVTSTESDDGHAATYVPSTESDDENVATAVTSSEDNYRNAAISVTSTNTEDNLACEDVIDSSGSIEKDSVDLKRGNKQRKTMVIPDVEYFTKALKCIACVFSSMSRKNFERHLKSCHPQIHIVVESSSSPSFLELKQHDREEETLNDALLWLYEDHDTCYMCCICKRVICVKMVLHCHILGHLKVNLGHCVVCDEITCLRPEHRKNIIVKTPRNIMEETKRSVQVLLGSVEHNGVPVYNLKPFLGTEELREKLDHLSTFCRKRFHCSVCLSCHVSLYSIHKHILLKHMNMPPFTCGACDFNGSGRYEVARHMHSKHPFEPLCLRYSPVEDSQHILFDVPGKRLHRKEYVVVGPNGSHRTSAYRSLESRRCKRVITGGKDRGSQGRVIGVSRYWRTRQHQQNRTKGNSGNHNDDVGEHQCSCCSFGTRLIKLLIEHKKECHPLVEILDEDIEEETNGWFGKMEVQLSEAGCKSLVSGGPMDTHVKTFYKCQTCNFRSESSDESIKHLRSKKPVKMVIQCSHCPAVFGQTDTFTRHVDLHHKQQNNKYIQIPLEAMQEEVDLLNVKVSVYRCVFCSYRSTMRARFETHLACHVSCITGNLL